MGQSLRMVAVLTLGLAVSCASSPDPVSEEESAAPQRRLPEPAERPWTLDEASAAVCRGKEGCEITEIWDEQSTGRVGLYVMALSLSPENASDTCPLSEYIRVDLQARHAMLLARTCPEGDFQNEVKTSPDQLTQQRTGGSMFNVTHTTFAYDLHRARPVEIYHHEMLRGRGTDRRQSWRFGALKGHIRYDLACSGTTVEAQETAFVDATLDSAADAATMASWDWGACSSPMDGEHSRVRFALVNGRRLIVQWNDVALNDTGDGALGELHVRVGSARQSLEQTGLLCDAQADEGLADNLTTTLLPVLAHGTHSVEGIDALWRREGTRVTGVIDLVAEPQALALRLVTALPTAPPRHNSAERAFAPEDATSTVRPHDLGLVGSPRARMQLPCALVGGKPSVDFEAWAAGRVVQLIQEP